MKGQVPLFLCELNQGGKLVRLNNYDFKANLHLYCWKDLNILLDVNSGAIHLLDSLACLLLQNIIDYQGDIKLALEQTLRFYPQEEVFDALNEFISLQSQGALFTQPDLPEFDLSSMKLKAICLNVAHACNMNCGYCFAAQGNFGLPASLMSLDTAKQAMEFLVENSGSIKNLEVDFFGGEPLLVFSMLRDLVSFCREREKEVDKRFNFTLTTNGLLLEDEVIDWVIANDISVILSLDGRKVVNDKHRLLNNGEGSYDLIVPKIKKMVARQPVSYFTRGTFTRFNLDFSRDLKHLIELGFDSISLEPAVGPDNGFSITEDDLPRVLLEYEKLTEVLLDNYRQGKDIEFFHYNLNLQQGPCLAKRVTGCGAGIEYLVITPEGEIYPCHQFVGDSDFYMGNIRQGIQNPDIGQRFAANQLKDKECINCWVRYFCGGGCHANAYYRNADLKKPHRVSCEMHKKRIEGAIYLDLCQQMSRKI
ncbi:MAG: thioether cross-link-forming SCIFF peptide maturase [Syntrophomonadaceae bacterium]|jgi:uncharacterized protein|nr:thioether cross-link-forming SCIFF peptide maturase [Syntrophomonadaceae bacterium]